MDDFLLKMPLKTLCLKTSVPIYHSVRFTGGYICMNVKLWQQKWCDLEVFYILVM